jgi:hypothetical protein
MNNSHSDIIDLLKIFINNIDTVNSGNISHKIPNFKHSIGGLIYYINSDFNNHLVLSSIINELNDILKTLDRINSQNLKINLLQIKRSSIDILNVLENDNS